MPVNFNGINPNSPGAMRPKAEGSNAVTDASKNGASAQPKEASSTSRADQVSFSSQAQNLKQLEDGVKRLPEVNQERVARIKAALADGSYHIDNQKLAGKLLSFEEETK